MAEQAVPGLGDLLSLFAGGVGAISKNIDQFRRGVSDFLTSVENFNQTMENMNEITARVNRLLDDVEEPIRAFMPQLTRSVKTADALINQLSGPVERVAPGLNRLAETLASPVLVNMPTDLGQFLETINDLARRLQPLSQIAESAGAMFGLRPLGVLRGGGGRPTPAPEPEPAAKPTPAAAAKKGAAKKKS